MCIRAKTVLENAWVLRGEEVHSSNPCACVSFANRDPQQVDEKLGRINMSLLPQEAEVSSGPQSNVPREKDVSHLVGTDPNEFKDGVVSAVADYGLFVNVEGVDGLLHISKMR